ncbi:MAG: hypothetical protein K2X35_08755 [Bryobacteraceae bacterium]|nr:hypothetical protein [Bryobacteraceae bacterium]
MEQRAAVQLPELSLLIHVTRAKLGDRTHASDRRNTVAYSTTGSIEGGPQTVFGGFHFGEVLQTHAKQLKLQRRDAAEWITRENLATGELRAQQ